MKTLLKRERDPLGGKGLNPLEAFFSLPAVYNLIGSELSLHPKRGLKRWPQSPLDLFPGCERKKEWRQIEWKSLLCEPPR